MKDLLFQVLNRISEIPASEADKLYQACSSISLEKGSHYITHQSIPKKFALVQKGLFRYYYLHPSGSEYTKGFFAESTFISSYTAMIKKQPSHLAIQALEPCEILSIDYTHWQSILQAHPCWTKFLYKIMAQAFEAKETRERELLLCDATERYLIFKDRFPGLESRISQNLVASYLGITNVALSRIRKKISLLT